MDEGERIEHPAVGTLTYDIVYGWVGEVTVGRWGGDVWPERVELHLTTYGSDGREREGPPAEEVLAALTPVLAAGVGLGEVIRRGLWEELVGAETEGTFWWTGGLAEVNRRWMSR